jgi:hypothetical protein
MKKSILFFALILLNGFAYAQTINVSLSVPATPFQNADYGAMAFGDIDNDGDQDLIITGKGGPIKTTLYINDGTGNFNVATGTPFVNVYGGTVGFADVNNDNFIDLLITGSTSATIRTANLYLNNGNGTFSIATTPFTPSYEGDFAFEDIDNDNDVDLILTGYNASDLGFTKLYLNNGTGVFSEVTSTPFEQLKGSYVAFIDIENDGDKDVILSGTNNSNIDSTKLYVNNGNGVFTLNTASSFTSISSGDIAIADSDNDGDMDILITGASQPLSLLLPLTKLYTNNGTGTFSEVVGTPFIGTVIGAAEFADFDNDGDKDVLLMGAGAVFNGISARAVIYQNQGNNTFTFSNELIATYFASIAIADIDGDNDLDFIFGGTHASQGLYTPKLYINNLNSPLGIIDNNNETSLSCFPNPSKDVVHFRIANKVEKITLFNLLGQEVLSKLLDSKEFQIDISNLLNGTYIAKLENNDQTQTIKLLKF